MCTGIYNRVVSKVDVGGKEPAGASIQILDFTVMAIAFWAGTGATKMVA